MHKNQSHIDEVTIIYSIIKFTIFDINKINNKYRIELNNIFKI